MNEKEQNEIIPLYHGKINVKGDYTEYHGWSVISMVENNLTFLENYIKTHPLLSQYVSALPTSSYHMTVYNIWSNGCKLLPHQKLFLNKHFPKEVKQLTEQSKKIGLFNPSGCMDELFSKLGEECRRVRDTPFQLKNIPIYKAIWTGHTVQLLVGDFPELSRLNQFRSTMKTICDRDDKMGYYHVTLGYTFKNVPEEVECEIIKEVDRLDQLLRGQTFSLCQPNVHYFDSMAFFHPMIL